MNSSAPLLGGKEPPQQTLPWIHHPGRKNGNTPLTAGASGELFCAATCGASTALSFTEIHIYEPAQVRLHFWRELLLPACSRGGKGDLHRVCLQSVGPCQANPKGSGGKVTWLWPQGFCSRAGMDWGGFASQGIDLSNYSSNNTFGFHC